MKKVLIFYSKTGGGHLRAAEALAEEISLRADYQVILSDGLEKTTWGHQTSPALLFFILSHYFLLLYNLIYKLTDNKLGLAVLRTIIKIIWGANFKKIIESEKPDLIITTHHFISPSTTSHLDIDKKVPFEIVVIDLGKPHRIWFDEKADQIIVPDQKMARWAQDKFQITNSKIKPIGYPLKKHFKQAAEGIFTNQILILGAGIESALVRNWIKQIQKNLPAKKIIIVCGHNRTLQKSLREVKDIQVFGFIDNLHHFLNRADILISKAGPGIVMEAATLKKPIIIVKVTGIQERANVDFVIQNNFGLSDPDGKNLVSSILKIYKDYKKYTANSNIISVGTDKIVDHLLSQ